MPEGHTVHRIARQFRADLVGHVVAASSPQGRFAAGAALLDGAVMTQAHAVGKQLFLEHVRDGGPPRIVRVHLGLYGAWDFAGRVTPLAPGGDAVGSLGAPRVRRAVRMGEGESALPGGADDDAGFPPPPVGQVRLRLASAETVADLRGPTACEVLTPAEVVAVLAKAGPDPHLDPDGGEDEFVRRLTARGTPVAALLMEPAVVSGIGNIYRAELLFRARLDPMTTGRQVPVDVARAIWRDWAGLLEDGIRDGMIITRDLDAAGRERALAEPTERVHVYKRTGEPCRVCGTPIAVRPLAGRSLYWCPTCQAA